MVNAASDSSLRAQLRELRAQLVGPYPGLRPFRRDEAHIFFGRDEQIDSVLERLKTTRLVAIAGESGCGKSSLVRAGVLPALESGFLPEGATRWCVAELRPGDRPIHHLAKALARAFPPTAIPPAAATSVSDILEARLRRGPRSIADLLHDDPIPAGTELLIVVDQFEELIRFRDRTRTDEADAFVALLMATIRDHSLPVRVVLTLRTEYLGRCAIFPGLPELLNNSQYLVPRLGRDQLMQTILHPARLFDGHVDATLANQLINELSQSPDQLPVMEHALLLLWRHRRRASDRFPAELAAAPAERPKSLAYEAYAALGGASKALDDHAEQVYAALPDEEHRRIARVLFCALWDEKASGSDTRHPCRVREAAELAGTTTDALKRVAEAFRSTEHSFLTPPPTTLLTDDTPLDVCHESLFRHWRALQGWIRDQKKDLEQYQQWCRLAWDRRLRSGDLLSERMLQQALEWRGAVQRNDAWVRRYSDDPHDFDRVEAFLRESQRAQAARIKRQKRNHRLLVIGIIAFVLVAIIAVANYAKTKRDEEKSAAQSEQLRQQVYSTAALSAQHREPMRSLQLALEAQGFDPGPQAEATLHVALRASHLRSIVFPSRNHFDAVKFLPDSDRLVTVGEADGLALWETSTGKRLQAFYGATPSRLAVASNGKLAATASNDGAIDLWDLEFATHRWTQHVQIARISDIALSPDDSLLATAGDDGRAVVWTTASGAENHVLIDHLGTVRTLAFSHDSARLATAGVDGRIVLWDAHTGQELGLLAHLPDITTLAFQATGGLVAVASGNRVVLFDPITRREEGTLPHSSKVTSVSFSPDGKRIAAVASDGELRVWDTADRTERLRIPYEAPSQEMDKAVDDGAGASPSVAFRIDSRALVTTGPDGNARVWEVEAGGELAAFHVHEAQIRRIAVSASGDRIVTASDDGTAAVWDLRGKPLLRTPKSAAAVKAMALDRDGKLLAISEGRWLKLWDVVHGPRTDSWWQAPDEIRDLRLFHDGDRVAVAAGRHIAVWNIAERRLMFDQDPGVDVDAIAIDPNEQWLVSECGDRPGADVHSAAHTLCLWDTRTGQRIATLSSVVAASGAPEIHSEKDYPHVRAVLALTVNEDGKWLASGSEDNTIKLWDVESRRLRATLPGHRASVSGLAASPDGRLLVSSGSDLTRLWDARTYKRRDEFPDAESRSDSVAFAPDSHWFAAGGHDGVVRLFSVNGETLRALAQDRVPLTLADGECQRYMQQRCNGFRTGHQLANEGRLLWREGNALGEYYLLRAAGRDAAAFSADSLRIISSQWLHAAMIVAGPSHPWAVPTDADPPGADDQDRIVRSIAAALDAGRPRGEDLVQHAQHLDPAIVVDPAELMAAAATARLASIARVFAEHESSGLAARILALAPRYGAREGWAEHAATAMANAKAIREITEDLAAGRCSAALDVFRSQLPRQHSPQRQVLLRFIATAYDNAGQIQEAAQLAEELYPWASDVEVLVSLADILLRARRTDKARAALDHALALDPVNDPALLLLARAHYESGQIARAAAVLRQVSPLTPIYRDAVGLAGLIVYGKLERLAEGYRTMVLAVDSKDAANWARLAESAWANNRFAEARLIANRVIEARAVARSSADVELAMRFVLVAALCRSHQYDAAEIELDRLVALAPSVPTQSWDYAGSRAAVSRLKTGPAKLFIQALLAYSESLGRTGDPEDLRKLLHDARDAHRY
jgi:WD40 repeat protein/tetratricopeptide (TPR) repeat protein